MRQLMGRPYRLVAAVKFGPQQEEPGGLKCGSNGANSNSSFHNGSSSTTSRTTTTTGSSSSSGVRVRHSGALMSTSSMDGTEAEVVPLLLRDGGRVALVEPEGILNQSPGPGRYSVTLTLHMGASPADELLHLEAACCTASSCCSDPTAVGHERPVAGQVQVGSSNINGSGNSSSSSSDSSNSGSSSSGGSSSSRDGSTWDALSTVGPRCIVLAGTEVELSAEGLRVQAEPLLQAIAGGLQGAVLHQALIVLDFDRRL